MTNKILIVEDERPVREMVAFTLRRAGFDPLEAADAHEADRTIASMTPELILLDWTLPGLDGVAYARRLRRDESTGAIPLIMLTARAGDDDQIMGLEAGADDYIVKPFSGRELVARIRAVTRRTVIRRDAESVQVGGLLLDKAAHRVFADDDSVRLGPTEFRLLGFLMQNPERVYSRGQLLDRAWNGNVRIEERTVDVHIQRLRKTLKPYGYDRLIQTVRGTGYRFSTKC